MHVIVQWAGSGELTSEVYAGPIVWVEEHGTVQFVQTSADVAAGRIHTALTTLYTPDGEFSYANEAPSVFTVVFGIALWRHTGNGPYAITDGSRSSREPRARSR